MMPSKNKSLTKIFTTTTVLSAILLVAMSCKECPTEPNPDPEPIEYNLQMSVRFKGCNILKLNVSNSDTTSIKNWLLKRDGKTILQGALCDTDTVITDSTVAVDSEYSYRLYFYKTPETFLDSSNIVNVQMPQSTSHNFTWTVDTLGTYGIFWDVYAVSENDVWAVGLYEDEIITVNGTKDTTYNAAHWNGNSWIQLSIPYKTWSGQLWYGELHSAYGFSSDEVYFLSGYGIVRWDGIKFIQQIVFDHMSDYPGAPRNLWGRSGSDLYAGGLSGYMVWTDGDSWERIPKFTDKRIYSITGNSEDQLWVTTYSYEEHGSMYHYDGNQWIKYWDENNPFYPFTSPGGKNYLDLDGICAIDDEYVIFMVGGSNGLVVAHSQANFYDYDCLFFHDTGWWRDIDGEGITDFFGAGHRNVVTHFNGKSQRNYQELSGIGFWQAVDQVGDAVFAAGEVGGGVVVPAVARGYR